MLLSGPRPWPGSHADRQAHKGKQVALTGPGALPDLDLRVGAATIMAGILAKGPLFLGSLFGVRPTPGSGTTPAGNESGIDSETQIPDAADSAIESQIPEHSRDQHQEPVKHRDVGKATEGLHQSQNLQPPNEETDKHTEHTSGFSSSGKYSLIRDVIVRAEFISDKQTKVSEWSHHGIC